ncbi:MAG: DUF4293 domain-containing protein [Bacteroidales bacterium]|nr:DUF4293 domain-containing protein [Bacteroidales bacterium]
MWQRIQTLYLFLSALLVGAMFFCDKAGDISYLRYLPYPILMGIILLLNILALTTFRFRVFQARTAVLSAIIALGFQGWLVVDFIATGNQPVFHVSAVFPVVCAILNILAARGIWADEMLVRSASRLRGARRRSHSRNTNKK